jgi:hypothetical protein
MLMQIVIMSIVFCGYVAKTPEDIRHRLIALERTIERVNERCSRHQQQSA